MLCDTIWWNYLFSSLVTSFRIMRIPDENVFKMKSQLHNKSKDYIQNVFIPNDHNVVSVDISLYLLVFISFPFLYSFILDSMRFIKSLTPWRHHLDYHVMEQGTVEACHWANCGHKFSADDDISVRCYIIRMVGQSFGVVYLILRRFPQFFQVTIRPLKQMCRVTRE